MTWSIVMWRTSYACGLCRVSSWQNHNDVCDAFCPTTASATACQHCHNHYRTIGPSRQQPFSVHKQLCGLLSKCQLTVPTTQSPKREVGTIALQPQAKACWVKVKRERKRVGFDWWMVWKWVSWGVSSTVVNVSPRTRPSSLGDSLVCIIAGSNSFFAINCVGFRWFFGLVLYVGVSGGF